MKGPVTTLLILLLLHCPILAEPLVMISVDGLNPQFYTSNEYLAPTMKRLAREGAYAEAVYPVFPSFTYPNHTALVTGCYPARHGIHTNRVKDGPAWFWDRSHIQVPTLWDIATQSGLRVGLLSWPTSVGSDVALNIPEVFHVPGANELSTMELLEKHSTPGLLERFSVRLGETYQDWDEETRRVAVGILQNEEVDLLLIHLIQVDKAQHLYGPDDHKVKEAVLRVDDILADIWKAAGAGSTFVVVGDHGFRSYRKIYRPVAALRRAGLQDRARVKATGGSAAIYTDDPEVLEVFAAEEAVKRILTETELQELSAFPGAKACLLASPGYIFSHKAEGPTDTKRVRGQHGHLPQEVPTGWLIHGPGIAPGTELGEVEIIHVAPTIAHLLGLKLPQAQGVSLLRDR